MSLITGVSTADEFLEAINDKGASLTNESTAYDLATAIDATGGNVSWQSPNEVVVAAVNAEVPSTGVNVNLTIHYATPTSDNHYLYLGFGAQDCSIVTGLFPLEGLEPGVAVESIDNTWVTVASYAYNFVTDTTKTKITIGETSYIGSDIANITDYPWLASIPSVINQAELSGTHYGDSSLTDADVVPDADVTIEIFETGYTE